MKKIKSIKQLQAEKIRLNQHLDKLEEKLHGQWSGLKQSFTPGAIIRNTYSSILQNRSEKNLNGESILKNTFAYGITLMAKKIADKAGEKFAKYFKK